MHVKVYSVHQKIFFYFFVSLSIWARIISVTTGPFFARLYRPIIDNIRNNLSKQQLFRLTSFETGVVKAQQ